jgi:hypothetical protein
MRVKLALYHPQGQPEKYETEGKFYSENVCVRPERAEITAARIPDLVLSNACEILRPRCSASLWTQRSRHYLL